MTRDVSNAASPWLDWHGLGGWNIYFLAKFALLWAGYLNFHPLINLVFAAFLIFPLPSTGLRRIRHWLALPIGAGIFYHDTWLPGIESIRAQGGRSSPSPWITGWSCSGASSTGRWSAPVS